MRRVVHLANYGGPYPGSFIPMIQAARAAVQEIGDGWTFEAVFSAGAKERRWFQTLLDEGMLVREAPALGRGGAVPWVRSLLGESDAPALLHTHFSSWDLPAAAAGRLRRGSRVLWHIHTPLLAGRRVRATNVVKFALAGRTVDRILCVGPEIETDVLARGAPRGRTELFSNGIDFGRFAAIPPAAREAARDRLGLPRGPRVLVTFAWDWERKGGSVFLRAAEILRAEGHDVLAVPVTVQGNPALAGEAEGVRALSAVEDARALYAAADVFVAASSGEGMPFSVLEALACGTPVVASDIPSHRSIGADVPTLRVVPRDAAAFAGALAAELAAAADLPGRAAKARAVLEPRFSLARWRADLVKIYRTL